MTNAYFYRGRHRAPTDTGKRIATVASATALTAIGSSVLMTPAATAATSMPTGLRNAIIACESGGQSIPTKIPGPFTASGLYQMTDGTWADNGGKQFARRAYLASASEQHAVADRLYASRGTQPWNASKSCWSRKVASGATASVIKVTPKVSDTPKKKVTSANASRTTKSTTGFTKRARVYTVKKGDTLNRIAQAQGVNGGWRTIHKANKGTVANPNRIFVGQKLVLS